MEITPAQFAQTEHFPPLPAGQRQLAESECGKHAILYVTKHGGKWRGLSKRFGNWHAIYMRMNRWPKSGVLDRVFAGLQQAQVVCIKIEAVAGQCHRESASGWYGCVKKTVRNPLASPEAAGPPGFIGLPRLLEQP